MQGLFWIVDVVTSRLGEHDEVEYEVGNEDGPERTATAETWGTAGVASRIRDGSDADGYAKALKIQCGDQIIVIATHDPRNMEPAEKGELVLHALGKDGSARALIRLKPDGVVEVEGTQVNVCGSSDAAALASKVDDLAYAFNNHVHATAGVGTPSTPAPLPAAIPIPTIPASVDNGSAKLKVGG